MNRAAAIGETRRVGGFALAGVEVLPAESAEEAGAAIAALDPEVGFVILTPAAHEAVAEALAERVGLVWAVLPE
ncbi:MAG: V-type ATP synthase subunit F [Gaiellaceae bacterium]